MSLKHSMKMRILSWIESYLDQKSPVSDPHDNIIGGDGYVFGIFINPLSIPIGDAFLVTVAVAFAACYYRIKEWIQ